MMRLTDIIWIIGDRARVNGASYSNYDSLRERVGTVIEVDELEKNITVQFNDQYTERVLRDPDMRQDVLMDGFDAFDKVEPNATTPPEEPITAVEEIGNELLPQFDELTTSDLQGCVAAEVSKRHLGREVEDMVLDYIHSKRKEDE